MSSRSIDRKKSDKPNARNYSPVVEFTAAAHEHVEPAFDVTVTPTTSQQTLGPYDIPAYGFIRHLYVQVSSSGGTLGPGTISGDFPWDIFGEVTLLDVNGAPIFGPMDGFSAFLATLFGGYAFRQDPVLHPDYSAGVITPTFGLRIPVEISHNNALGALANQNSAASYKFRATINTIATIWAVAPTAAPALRVRGWLEAWSQPAPSDLGGRPQAVIPPRHGTTQYWNKQSKVTALGDNTVRVDRVGNLIRNLIFVFRDVSGVRSTTVPPDPLELRWDARQLTRESQFVRRAYMGERYLYSALPNGVYCFSFTHDVLGHGGDGTPELWLPTVQSTRLELAGSNFGAAGSIDILTNDVAPVEIRPTDRYVESSSTGFSPIGG